MTQLSPWLVRLLCDNCGEEHYRYFDKARREETFVVQGQCRVCYDNIQAALIAFNMIKKPLGQRAWTQSFHSSADRNTYTQAPAWRYGQNRAYIELKWAVETTATIKRNAT